MNISNIQIQKTNYPQLKKFNIDFFLVKAGKYKFSHPEEAKSSALAGTIFTLPYVKTVFIAENFVAVEIIDDFDWEEAENAIIQAIKKHLESGKKAVENEPQFFPVEVYTEMDIGPGTLKFVANKKLVLQPAQFDFNKEVLNSPLAAELFKFPYVKRVRFEDHYIILTKGGSVQWDEVTMELREFIRQYLMKGKPVMEDESRYV